MVRDQTRSDWVVCASDYAIAAIASIESSYMAAMNLTGVRLSAQQIMDCTGLQCHNLRVLLSPCLGRLVNHV